MAEHIYANLENYIQFNKQEYEVTDHHLLKSIGADFDQFLDLSSPLTKRHKYIFAFITPLHYFGG